MNDWRYTLSDSKMASLLNKKAVRDFALASAKENRHHAFERVSGSFFDGLEGHVRQRISAKVGLLLEELESEIEHRIVGKVRALPSVGKTIR